MGYIRVLYTFGSRVKGKRTVPTRLFVTLIYSTSSRNLALTQEQEKRTEDESPNGLKWGEVQRNGEREEQGESLDYLVPAPLLLVGSSSQADAAHAFRNLIPLLIAPSARGNLLGPA